MRTFSERIAGQPLDEIALELSHDFDAQADLALCRRRMDALALELEGLSDASALEQTRALGDLTRDFTRSPEFYYTPANSYLTRVLNGGPAIPITLAALWVGLGRRAGISVDGIGFPGHFLVRVGGHVIVDVFERGRVLSMNDLRTFAQRLPEPPTNLQSLLEPSNQEQAARRMLLNVRRACMAVGDEARALLKRAREIYARLELSSEVSRLDQALEAHKS